jgi:cell division inhibitor SepF
MLKRIESITPLNYNDARPIGEAFRDGVPVVMNLSEIGDDDAKRLVDFSAGLVFAAHGSLRRITAKVFLLLPANVEFSEEDKAAITADGFYNQS